MAARVMRLTRVELTKILLHPFFPVALVILALVTTLSAWLFEPATTVWRGPHALLLFSFGAKSGLKIASFLLVIFGSLSFAGEFDKGTIKILLTRPVTRTDVFLAKCLTGLALGATFFLLVLAISFGFGCLKGDLGPVWEDREGLIRFSTHEIANHAIRAIGISAAGVLAAVFLGIVVSTVVESSGFAVAVALTIFIGIELGLGLLRDKAHYIFYWYPTRAFDILEAYAKGSSELGWRSSITSQVDLGLFTIPIWLGVPLATIAICSIVGYIIFKTRNILA